MKKLLLFALIAMMAVSASAQRLSTQKSGKAQGKAMPIMAPATLSLTTDARQYKLTQHRMDRNYGKKLTLRGGLKQVAGKKSLPVATAPRKAGEVQALYRGIGVDYSTSESASWEMKSGSFEDGTPGFVNVVPSLWEDEDLAVEYTIDGGTITIKPQVVAQTESGYFVILASGASSSGDIVMTLGDDGSLSVDADDELVYGAFTSETFSGWTSTSNGGNYAGYYQITSNIRYLLPDQKLTPIAGYEPQDLFLHYGCNVNWNYWPYAIVPAYADINLLNRTTDPADKVTWSVNFAEYDESSKGYQTGESVATSNTQNFTFSTIGGYDYEPATLVVSYDGQDSEPFNWTAIGDGAWEAGGSIDLSNWGDTPKPTMGKANPAGQLTLLNMDGVHSLILYQGKPATPLYFEGVNLMMYQFKAGKSFNLTCKIHKAYYDENGRFNLGELIAQSDLDKNNIITGSNATQLNWNSFYVEDEWGMSTDIDHLFIDEEFAVVIEGIDNGTFQGDPLFMTSITPSGQSSTYCIITGETEYTGYGWRSFNGAAICGFNSAFYGYLYTEDDTNISIPNEGGSATLKVKPMLISSDESGAATTRIFLDEELPEWLSAGIVSEDYTSDEEHGFVLGVEAEALPADVEGREAYVTLWQEGAQLILHVTQGVVDGISTTKATLTRGGKTYNLQGMPVKADAKGMVIQNGKKFINK